MKLRDLSLRAGLLVIAIGLLGGCTLPVEEERHLTPGVRAPESVEWEERSDAMHVLEAMGISGQHDLPRELAASGPALVTSLDQMSPLGKIEPPARRFQVVAWVPADQVVTPRAAAGLAFSMYQMARVHAFPVIRSDRKVQTCHYPTGSGEDYASFQDIFDDRPVPFAGNPVATPEFIGPGKSYGPIFIKDLFEADAELNKIDTVQAMLAVSKALPEWMWLYHPDMNIPQPVPAQVIHRGKALYFIGK